MRASPTPPPGRRSLVGAAALSWLSSAALYTALPSYTDQLAFGYMGWRVVAGDVPYRGFVNMDWPATIWLHALSSWLLGNHLWTWRVADFALMAMGAAFLVDLLRRSAPDPAARIALVLYPLAYVALGWNVSGQHDMLGAHFLCGALWFHVRGYDSGSTRSQWGTGAFLGAAMLCKPTLAALGVLLAAQALWIGRPLREVVAHTSRALGGTLATLALAFAALLAEGASPGDIADCLVGFNLGTQFAWVTPVATMLQGALLVHVRWWPVLGLGGLAAGLWILRARKGSAGATALWALWATGIVSLLVQRKGYAYHLGPCVPALVGLVSIGLGEAASAQAAPGRWKAWAARLSLPIAAAGLIVKIVALYGPLLPALRSGSVDPFLARFRENDLTIAEARAMARQIAASTPPGQPVYVVGDNLSLSYLSERAMPTGLFYWLTFTQTRPPLPFADAWLDRWEREIRRSLPSWCLVDAAVERDWLPGPYRSPRILRELLASRYRRVGPFGPRGVYVLYERIPGDGPGGT